MTGCLALALLLICIPLIILLVLLLPIAFAIEYKFLFVLVLITIVLVSYFRSKRKIIVHKTIETKHEELGMKQIYCRYCGEKIDVLAPKCPYCGGRN
jgi:hypothetical protein